MTTATVCAAEGLRGALEQLLDERPRPPAASASASSASASESASASASAQARGVRPSEPEAARSGRAVDAVIFSLCAALADPDETVRAAAFCVLVSSFA